MSEALKELTNIGIPIYTPLRLWIQDMTLTCSDHKGKTIGLEREIRREVLDRVDKVVGKTSANNARDFLRNIDFYANESSTSEFNITNRDKTLNLFENLLDLERIDGENEKEVLEKIEEEKEILFSLITYISNTPYTKEIYKSIKEYSELYFGKKDQDLRSYLKVEKNYYDEAYGKLKDINAIDYTDLLKDYTDDLNPEKVSIYLAGYYMDEVYKGLINSEYNKTQEALLYIAAFLRTGIDKSIILPMNGRGETSYTSIKQEYEKLLRIYPQLKDLYLKRSYFENRDLDLNKDIIENMINMKNIKVKGNFIKPGEAKEIEYTDGTHRRKNHPATEEEKRQIEEYLEYKRFVFLKNKPIAQILGEDYFSNYVAFLYENGMMPADRFLNVNTISQMKADSIYIFDASNIKERIYLDKTTLRRISEIKPLNHSGNWEERLELIANQETNNELKEKAKQLVKEN